MQNLLFFEKFVCAVSKIYIEARIKVDSAGHFKD